MRKTRVFISSTCYDLSQVRTDLQNAIREMGHEPILSENKDFPVDPSLSSVENCIEAVKNDADVFVLIIGNKYGYQLDSGRSITNTEFLTAVEKGIPVYTFALQEMVHLLPVWTKNPTGDFSNVVDNNMVFAFLDEVRRKSAIWNFEFNSAQDIIEILRSQLSFLLNSSLEKTKKLGGINSTLLDKVSGKAIEILVNKTITYEYQFFFQVLLDEIDSYQTLKKDCVHSVYFKLGDDLPDTHSFMEWQNKKLVQIMSSIDSLQRLFTALKQYLGDPGVPSDLEGLYYVAHRLGAFYASLLEWVIDVKSAQCQDLFQKLKEALSDLPLGVIKRLEEYAPKSLSVLSEINAKYKRGESVDNAGLKLELSLAIPDDLERKYYEELDKVSILLGCSD